MFDFDDLEEADAAQAASTEADATAASMPGEAGFVIRWGVDIHAWQPLGEADGEEFQFLLGLIQEQEERDQVLKYKFWEDKKRALMSRLLMRRASACALKHRSFREFAMKRTKGKKPFLASPLPPEDVAPNWNANVSHEGAWVVCASEPLCVCGVDVAELRRIGRNGQPIDFYKVFEDNLTSKEWADVRKGGPTLDDQYEVFARYWSAKEALVKARGDGLAFPLGRAEFSWTPLADTPAGTAYRGTVRLDGCEASSWAFIQHRMPGERAHWATVARGSPSDIIDAHGVFTQTLRRGSASFTSAEWEEALAAPSHEFAVLPVRALVPEEDVDAYLAACGSQSAPS